MDIIWEEAKRKYIMNYIAVPNLRTNIKRTFLKPLLASDQLAYTIPEKPQSRLQKYITKR